ncbi:signal recognition particle-docking protein FtsY [Candidatus Woesearchaeota archaeon]|nr:signal recognition particle-docking protein FtsY [Candidatus Woesearchaeota archaeon]
MHKREEEGEKEIDELLEKKKKEQEEQKQKEEKKEEKGFFARLKDKFTHKEEEQKKEAFEVNEAEVKEFEEAFKEVETKPEIREEEEKEEKIPVVTQTEDGETIFELQEKPTAVGHKKDHKEESKKEAEQLKKEAAQQKKEQKAKKEEQKKEQGKEEPEEETTGFFGLLKDTIFKTSISEEKFEELFWDLEVALLENNVAVEVIDLIKKNLKKELVEKKILRGQINEIILKTLKESVEQTFDVEQVDLIEKIKEKKPYIVVFVGINGSGKTTTIAKMIQKLKDNNLSCVVAAGDTFRAAAIQQLEEHTTRLNVKLIKHDYGSDPAAVGFDAIKYAQAHNIDCVLIDTAGRLHSNVNLMDEMKKIIRVTKPDFKIFIGEAITGNDCVDQARKFNEAVGIDGIILAKADVDEKGGAALSIGYVTKKPILYLGTGQEYKNLEEFDKEKVMEQLGLG